MRERDSSDHHIYSSDWLTGAFKVTIYPAGDFGRGRIKHQYFTAMQSRKEASKARRLAALMNSLDYFHYRDAGDR